MLNTLSSNPSTKSFSSKINKSAISSVTNSASQKTSATKQFNEFGIYPSKDIQTPETSKKTNSTQVAKMYFPKDYSKAPASVGKYNLNPNQSRIMSAISLGKSPFANSSSVIADNYGFNTASSASPSSTPIDISEDISIEDQENELEDSFEDLNKEFDRIQREDLQDKLDKLNPKQTTPKDSKAGLIERILGKGLDQESNIKNNDVSENKSIKKEEPSQKQEEAKKTPPQKEEILEVTKEKEEELTN